jgi:hypothetical protein
MLAAQGKIGEEVMAVASAMFRIDPWRAEGL